MRLSKGAIALGVLGIALLGLVAMSSRQPRLVTATFDPPYPQFNASGDSIEVVMEGRIPCPLAGCDRLKVTLVLYTTTPDRRPSTYWLGVVGTSGNDTVVNQGNWEIKRGVAGYPEAIVYALDKDAGLGLRHFWLVSESILLPLDEGMRARSGNGAWGSMLSRYDAPYGAAHVYLDEIAARGGKAGGPFTADGPVSDFKPPTRP
jgi:hypothetical protein